MAGQDLTEVTDPNFLNISTIIQEHYNPIILKIRNLNKPVIALLMAQVRAGLVFLQDIIVVQKTIIFTTFSKIGLIPDSGSTYFLPRQVGIQKAWHL